MDSPPKNAPWSNSQEVDLLLEVVPAEVVGALYSLQRPLDDLIEIVLDLGRQPEARFPDSFCNFGVPVSHGDLEHVVSRISAFGEDNRAGIERSLHRISALRNRQGLIVGLTLRVGRALYGTIEMIRDIVESSASLMLLGKPGVGKTTLLREAARVASDELQKRVIVVDTSNEIAGDGDIPHPGIGHARRMQVAHVAEQHKVMIEAVENHMPEVVVIDEIGTAEEALAARTIAERGVQLIATAHGLTLKNLIKNPTLSDLIGGIQAVTLGDDEARRRGSQKTVLERKALPTFTVLIEIQDRETMVVHHQVATSVDLLLRNQEPQPETRIRKGDGSWERQRDNLVLQQEEDFRQAEQVLSREKAQQYQRQALAIYSFGVNRSLIERAIYKLSLPLKQTREITEADAVIALKAQNVQRGERLLKAYERGLPILTVRSNTPTQVETALKSLLKHHPDLREMARSGSFLNPLEEAEQAIEQVVITMKPIELRPQDAYMRRLQHELVEQSGLRSRSNGEEPQRRVVIYP